MKIKNLLLCVQNQHFGLWRFLEFESVSGLCSEGDFWACNVLAISMKSGFLTVESGGTIYKISILSSVSHFESLNSNQII